MSPFRFHYTNTAEDYHARKGYLGYSEMEAVDLLWRPLKWKNNTKKSKSGRMLVLIFNIHQLVHFKLVPKGEIVTTDFYS